MTGDTFGWIIGILGTLTAIVVGISNMSRNKVKDSEETGHQSGQVMSELGYVKSGIDDIKNEMRDQRQTNMQFMERLSAVESSTKQAHHRIDQNSTRIDQIQQGKDVHSHG